ncbi:MAG: hypothetical protein RL756_2286 [Pseudomonadota bacterium]
MAQSLDNLSRTWSDAGTTFTAIKYDITDSGSAAGSLLMDLQVGSASKFSVGKIGAIQSTSLSSGAISGSHHRVYAGFTARSNIFLDSASNTVGFQGPLIIGGNTANTTAPRLDYDDAGTLAQRNGANAQTFRLYGTYTAADNFQRLAITSASVTLSALSGASVTATGLIPAGAVVMGVTSRVSTLITGADGYQIGTAADADRWADKTGVAVGTTTDNRDWTAGTIENFAAATDVIVTAKTANFTAGAIVVTVHYLAGQAD